MTACILLDARGHVAVKRSGREHNGETPLAQTEDLTDRLLPGSVRVSIQIYDPKSGRSYRSLTGFAVSGLKVRNRRELNRLWKKLERETRAGWRDDEQRVGGDRDGAVTASRV